jgi:hypothetical protein
MVPRALVLLFLTYPLLARLSYLHLHVEIKKLSVGLHSWASVTALTPLLATSTKLPGGGEYQQLRAHLSAASFTSICHLPHHVSTFRGSLRVIYTIYTHTFERARHCYDIYCLRSYHHHCYLLMPILLLGFTARYLLSIGVLYNWHHTVGTQRGVGVTIPHRIISGGRIIITAWRANWVNGIGRGLWVLFGGVLARFKESVRCSGIIIEGWKSTALTRQRNNHEPNSSMSRS